MSAKLIEILVMEGVAAVLFLFAYLIGVRNRMDLIAGYNERSAARVSDKAGLKRLIVRCCVLVGIGSALMPLLTHFAMGHEYGFAYAIGGYGGFIVGIVAMVALQARDYVD